MSISDPRYSCPPGRPVRHPLIARLLAGSLLLLGLAACAHYQLGTGARPGFATLYVAPVENRSSLPQAQATVAAEIREAFIKDGRVALASSAAGADATLRVTLTGYDRDAAVARASDTGLARKFNLHLRATCTLVDNRSGKTLFAGRALVATKDVYTDSGQVQSEYQAVPLLAGDLAWQVAHTVLDVW